VTIAVAVKTGSFVVFAADSKLTTVGIAGINPNGTPNFVEQTYDNATKVAHDRNGLLMAMVAGHASIGEIAATDFIAKRIYSLQPNVATQDQDFSTLVTDMVTEKQRYWSQHNVPQAQWLGPTLLLAAPQPGGVGARVWQVDLKGAGAQSSEILLQGGVRLEGTYDSAFSLLYGFQSEVLARIAAQLSLNPQNVFQAASQPQGWLRPLEKMNFAVMPLQDAVDLAFFLATVQVEMERFLPGTPACGGPIDVMVLHTVPDPRIQFIPGKEVHHPRTS